MRSVSTSSKLRLNLKVSWDHVNHFSPGFLWFLDAIWCNLTCFSIFCIDNSSLLDNQHFLSHIQAIFGAESSRFSTIILHNLAERRDRSLLLMVSATLPLTKIVDLMYHCQPTSDKNIRWINEIVRKSNAGGKSTATQFHTPLSISQPQLFFSVSSLLVF